MFLKVLIFTISIIQLSVCNPISTASSSYCAYKNQKNFTSYIAVDCEGAGFHQNSCENLKDDVNISSISAVTFRNCEIAEYSDILNRFPNISKLAFSSNNTLPSADFSNFEHLTLFKNIYSEFKPTSALLSMNAANLEWFYFEDPGIITSISMKNAGKLEFFNLENTTISILPADLFENSTNLKIFQADKNKIEKIETLNLPHSVRWMNLNRNKIDQLTKSSFENFSNLQILTLSGNAINGVDTESLSQLSELSWLDLSSNRIKEINRNTLKGLNNVVFADFGHNDINYIEEGAFESTTKLFALNLGRNNISILNQQMLAGLNGLISLNLDKTSIRELTAETFGNLTELRILDMRDGTLETVDFNAFANLPKLGHLNLANNKISRLVKMTPTIWNQKSKNQTTNTTIQSDFFEVLDKIDVKWLMSIINKTGSFGNEEFYKHFFGKNESSMKKLMVDEFLKTYPRLKKGSNYGLKILYLSGNQLTEIEKNIFAELNGLKELDLTENPITTLYPESFAGLNELESLTLDECKLTSIDFNIFTQMTKLEDLSLSNNRLTTITAAPLPSIERLYLNDNQLTDFPLKRSDLMNLMVITLGNNKLVEFPFSMPEHQCVEIMKNLNYLFLSNNSINHLYPHFFAGLNELIVLDLDDLELKSVDFSIFTQLTKLDELYLSNNKITSITVAPLPSIRYLYLNNNTLPADFPMKKSDFPNLKKLEIESNPLNCSTVEHSFADADTEFRCRS